MTLLLLWLFVGTWFLEEYWYIFVIGFYSIILLFKFFLIGGDNVLWFAICLMFLGCYMLGYKVGYVQSNSYPLLIIIPAFVSLIVFVTCGNVLHMLLFVFLILLGSPLFLLSLNIVNIWWFLFIEMTAFVVSVIIINLIYLKYKR
jgi:hypothetical protein